MKTALLSAYKKTERLAEFARALKDRGWELVASAGTKTFLAERGVEALDVARIVGKPILGHRVVTLSREIHAGLLAREEDDAELAALKIRRIDLVYVDLYPLEEAIAREGATEASVIEQTDIGGPALLRSSAKGRRIVLSSEERMQEALAYIDSGTMDRAYLSRLAEEAELRAAAYAKTSADFISRSHRARPR